MFKELRKRVTFVNVAMTLALVFAMSGGAYAAKKFLITSTKQISPSVLKQLKGNAGPAGAQGAPGAPGSNGAPGKDGSPGKDGTNGSNGKSVVAAAEGKGANCAEGGSSFEVEGSGVKHYACNGKTGAKGEEGEPGAEGPAGPTGPEGVCSTSNCHLPSNVTETGTWSAGQIPATAVPPVQVIVPISFAIPLAAPLSNQQCVEKEEFELCQAHYVNPNGKELNFEFEEVSSTVCTGSVADPTATPGNLCIYATKQKGATVLPATILDPSSTNGGSGAAKTGTLLGLSMIFNKGTEEVEAFGTWAVTAP